MQDPLVQQHAGRGTGLVYLMLNLPFFCNYTCLKCCNLLEDTQPSVRPRSDICLDREKTAQVISGASETGIKVLVVAGEGEPLLHPDFTWLLDRTVEAGLLPYVFTNGSRLTDENIKFLANKRASIIVSMDSLDPAKYQQLTGGEKGGDLRVLLKNIEKCRAGFSALIEPRNGIRIGSLALNMVVTKLNYEEVSKIKAFCGDDVVFVSNQPTRIGLGERNWEHLYGTLPHNPDVDAALANVAASQRPLGTTSDGSWCAYMRNGMSVSSDGRVITCAYSLETAGGYSPLNTRDLVAANMEVMASVNKFYETSGHHRCILRHPKYKQFVNILHAERAA